MTAKLFAAARADKYQPVTIIEAKEALGDELARHGLAPIPPMIGDMPMIALMNVLTHLLRSTRPKEH